MFGRASTLSLLLTALLLATLPMPVCLDADGSFPEVQFAAKVGNLAHASVRMERSSKAAKIPSKSSKPQEAGMPVAHSTGTHLQTSDRPLRC